jgi:hypothetical protein
MRFDASERLSRMSLRIVVFWTAIGPSCSSPEVRSTPTGPASLGREIGEVAPSTRDAGANDERTAIVVLRPEHWRPGFLSSTPPTLRLDLDAPILCLRGSDWMRTGGIKLVNETGRAVRVRRTGESSCPETTGLVSVRTFVASEEEAAPGDDLHLALEAKSLGPPGPTGGRRIIAFAEMVLERGDVPLVAMLGVPVER